MSTVFSIITLVLGAGVMVFLFLQNQSLKGRNTALESELKVVDRDREQAEDRLFNHLAQPDPFMELYQDLHTVATQELDSAYRVINVLLAHDLENNLAPASVGVQIDQSGTVEYVIVPGKVTHKATLVESEHS